MRPTDVAVAAIAVTMTLGGAAQAAPARDFAIPAGPLDQAIRLVAQQGGIDIGSAEPGLTGVRVPALRWRGSPRAALARLLRGTGFEALALDDRTYRIVRRALPVARAPQPARAPLVRRRAVPAVGAEAEVVVTASKAQTSLLRYPGSAILLPHNTMADLGKRAGPGFSEAAAGIPILQSTSQGAGRDKVFVRGIADSSFVGPTQSTVTVYFGDVQLGYNGPDPNLSLYDIDRVEVLEGPQGTLYGAGAIGGIVRLEPRAPDLSQAGAHAAAGASVTRSGDPGYDGAAMLNLPIVADTVGVRAVVYRAFDGGYIDDVRRDRTNVNDTTTTGGRIALRAVTGGWTFDTGIIGQRIHAGDLQYAQRGLPGLSRQSSIAQPFSQRYALGRVVIGKQWSNGLRLLLATGLVHHNSVDRFDATRRSPVPIAYDVADRSRLLTQEARLSRATSGWRWLAGLSMVRASDRYRRVFGPLDQQREIVGVANRASLSAVFGEATVDVSRRLAVTVGARATHARIDGESIDVRRVGPFLRGRTTNRVDPTVAASWLIAPRLALFARRQSGFRTGGIAVAPGVGRVADFDADTLSVSEIGLRRERSGALGFSGSVTASLADWDRVQADLIARSGFPYTANIGSARVRGLEFVGSWVPVAGLRLDAALFANHSRIVDPSPGLAATKGSRLPMSPSLSGSFGAAYRWTHAGRQWSVDANLRRVGSSLLGTQAPLDLRQRGYTTLSAGMGVTLSHGLELTARIDNLLDARGDRYASGNGFGIVGRDQYTPLRPRTMRIGLAIPFGPDPGPHR